jgi:hypothetical protein
MGISGLTDAAAITALAEQKRLQAEEEARQAEDDSWAGAASAWDDDADNDGAGAEGEHDSDADAAEDSDGEGRAGGVTVGRVGKGHGGVAAEPVGVAAFGSSGSGSGAEGSRLMRSFKGADGGSAEGRAAALRSRGSLAHVLVSVQAERRRVAEARAEAAAAAAVVVVGAEGEHTILALHYTQLTELLKSLAPSKVDVEMRSLCADGAELDPAGAALVEELARYFKHELKLKRNFEALEAYLNRYLKIYAEMILGDPKLVRQLRGVKSAQHAGWQQLQDLLYNNLCLVRHISHIQ